MSPRSPLLAFAFLLALFEGPAEIACLMALVTLRPQLGLALSHRPGRLVLLGVALWAGAGWVGTALARARGVHLGSEDQLRPLLALALGVGAAGFAGADRQTLGRAALLFLVGLAANALVGYLQVAWGPLPIDAWLLKNPRSQQLWIPEREFVERCASGLFYNRLKLAHVGIAGVGLAGLLALAPGTGRRRGLAAAAALFIGGAVLLSYARMAVAALLGAALLLALILRQRAVILAAVGGVLATGIGVMLLPRGLERVLRVGADLAVRLHLYDTAVGVFLSHPILGVGHGMYRKVVGATWDGKGQALDAHSLFLHALAETGLVGLAGLLLAIGTGGWLLLARVSRDRARHDASALLDRFALFVLLALLLLGVLHVSLHHAPVALLFWTALGVGVSGKLRLAKEPASSVPS